MKKTYNSPALTVVGLCPKSVILLTGSIEIDGTKTATETNGGWTKEENNPITDKNVWDNEW